jgi:hypothetical protein
MQLLFVKLAQLRNTVARVPILSIDNGVTCNVYKTCEKDADLRHRSTRHKHHRCVWRPKPPPRRWKLATKRTLQEPLDFGGSQGQWNRAANELVTQGGGGRRGFLGRCSLEEVEMTDGGLLHTMRTTRQGAEHGTHDRIWSTARSTSARFMKGLPRETRPGPQRGA